MDRGTLLSLWETHKADDWPRVSNEYEGPLMTLDTVICGCIVYYLDGQDGLDEQRRAIIGDCLSELESLEQELEDDCRPYFQRLHELGTLLLIAPRSAHES